MAISRKGKLVQTCAQMVYPCTGPACIRGVPLGSPKKARASPRAATTASSTIFSMLSPFFCTSPSDLPAWIRQIGEGRGVRGDGEAEDETKDMTLRTCHH